MTNIDPYSWNALLGYMDITYVGGTVIDHDPIIRNLIRGCPS